VKTYAVFFAVASSLVAGCKSGQPIDELRAHANESFDREEYKRTIAFDTEILRLKPDDYSATVQRGVAFDRVGDAGSAQQDYSKAIEVAPDAALPRLYRANLAIKTNQVDQAIPDIQALQGLEMEKHEQVAALVLAGTVSEKKGDWGNALRSFRQAIDLGHGDPDPATMKHVRDATYNASECCYRMGDFERACGYYQDGVDAKLRAEEPVTEDDSYMLGVLNYLRGDFAKARASFANVSPARQKQAAKLLNDEGFFTVAAAK
jgi:Flp pilus assembly protein TadD